MTALSDDLPPQLPPSGLSEDEEQAIADRLQKSINNAKAYFSTDPDEYVNRVRDLLWSAFFPQKQPLLVETPSGQVEILARNQA